MPNFICTTCGTQYAESDNPPDECAICQDERQYVGWNGQQWTTLDQLRQDPDIEARLNDILGSMLCSVSGCWSLHGGQVMYFFDPGAESHVLEVWPVGFEEPSKPEGNGREADKSAICYELAEFDFAELLSQITLGHFHFSQRRSIFEIGWWEDGQRLELRVHIVPAEVADDY